jgi:hypothetical protein
MFSSVTYKASPRAPALYHSPPSCCPSLPLLTPPPLKHFGSPYARVPLPPVPEDYSAPSINPILRFSTTNILFNLILHPLSIPTHPDHRPLSLHELSEPATFPPLPQMTIVSPHLSSSVVVLPTLPSDFVAVSDVLVTLQHFLDHAVTVAEYGSLLSKGAAYEERIAYSAHWQTKRYGTCKGVKRVDFLMNHHHFNGLSRVGGHLELFILNIC